MESSRQSRIIAVALGSSGDVNPVLGVVRGLVRRGHEVFVLANEVFEGPAKAVGAAFEPLGSAALYDGFVSDPRFWKWPFNVERAFKEGWVPLVRPAYDLIAALAKPGKTVVLASSFAMGAWLAREKLGIPFAAMHVSPMVLPSLDELPEFGPVPLLPRFLGRPGRRLFYAASDTLVNRWLAPGVNEVRRSLGLHPRKRVYQEWLHASDRVIGVWPEWFAPPQSSWPEGTTLAGFVGYDRGNGAEPLDAAVEAAFRGPPPVVVTAGSSMAHASRFLAAASKIPDALGRTVLFVTDRSFTPPADMPAGITHLSYLSYSSLLPRAAAIVHHGGIGTGSAALRAGIPQVIVPIAFDQFDNAHRFERLGVARRLPFRRLGPRSLARALKEVLESETMRTASRGYAARIDTEAAVSAACEVVESLG